MVLARRVEALSATRQSRSTTTETPRTGRFRGLGGVCPRMMAGSSCVKPTCTESLFNVATSLTCATRSCGPLTGLTQRWLPHHWSPGMIAYTTSPLLSPSPSVLLCSSL
uniref:Uncharacterized protein n=1 Tax=Cacopsylla melanoneura TaxID=428564 RepID=A0A8D8XUN3_9HEMI